MVGVDWRARSNMLVSSGPTFQASSVLFKAIEDGVWVVSCADIGCGFFWSVWWRDAGTRGGLADGSIRVWEDGVIRVHLGWHRVDNVFANPRAASVLLRLLRAVTWVQHGRVYAVDDRGKCMDGQQPCVGNVDRHRRQQYRRVVGTADRLGNQRRTDGDPRCW